VERGIMEILILLIALWLLGLLLVNTVYNLNDFGWRE
jgi:hypothetical protein